MENSETVRRFNEAYKDLSNDNKILATWMFDVLKKAQDVRKQRQPQKSV